MDRGLKQSREFTGGVRRTPGDGSNAVRVSAEYGCVGVEGTS